MDKIHAPKENRYKSAIENGKTVDVKLSFHMLPNGRASVTGCTFTDGQLGSFTTDICDVLDIPKTMKNIMYTLLTIPGI